MDMHMTSFSFFLLNYFLDLMDLVANCAGRWLNWGRFFHSFDMYASYIITYVIKIDDLTGIHICDLSAILKVITYINVLLFSVL
jgi:hypothetical protein